MTNTTSPEFDISQVAGNAPDNIKVRLGSVTGFLGGPESNNSFGNSIQLRLKVIELSIISKTEEPTKLEGRAVLEIDVAEDMINGARTLHGGCLAFLIDVQVRHTLG